MASDETIPLGVQQSGPLTVGIPRETYPGERRVAAVPATVEAIERAGMAVLVERGAGAEAGFDDAEYADHRAELVADRDEVFAKADVVLQVRMAGANPDAGREDFGRIRRGQVLIGMCDPLGHPQMLAELAERQATVFALELLPRITRAQSMDVLSSMATVAGYKAVLLAANHLPRLFPMMMTAAGTLLPARVFVIGAGVAGLQAIATARRLGANVQGYDVRPEVREQVESLGAKFVELGLEGEEARQEGGYARAMGEDFYRRQREMMSRVVAESDVVITTAAVPGKRAPVLVTTTMLENMSRGSVVVDLAAETGGNCEATQPGETVTVNGVTVLGPLNVPSSVPYHASQMYAKNISTFLVYITEDGRLNLDRDDEILRDTLVCRDGAVVHPRIQQLLGGGTEAEAAGSGPAADSEAQPAQPPDESSESPQ